MTKRIKRNIDDSNDVLTFADKVVKKKDTRKVTVTMKETTYKKLWHYKIEKNISTISEIIEEALAEYFDKLEEGEK